MMKPRFWPIYGTLAIMAALPLAACAGIFSEQATSSFHTSVPNAPATLEVHNPAGQIVVQAWDKPSIQVDADIHASSDDIRSITISVQPQGSTLVVDSKIPSSLSNCKIEYTIHAPASTNLSLHQAAGNLETNGFTRDVDATVSAGREVVAMAALGGSQRVSLHLSVGELILRVPTAADARVDASTSVGGIFTDFPLSVSREVVGSSANGSIGKGSATVVLSNSTGAIRITRE
jgi:hypothetical protein